jgi:hypothetical protein
MNRDKTMNEPTKRFITAYNEIDAFLRRLCKAKPQETFCSLVTKASTTNAGVRSCSQDLREFADLRNAITHHYKGNHPIATPLASTVQRFEAIRGVLLSPPKIGGLFSKSVEVCELSDPIGTVAADMLGSNYSQVPAYHRQNLVGLLTTDTIARWVASCLEENDGILEEAPVKAVMEHAEYTDNYTLLDPKDTVFGALECFANFHRRGRRLDAIIIAHGKSKKSEPLGMMTASDIPEVHDGRAKSGCR